MRKATIAALGVLALAALASAAEIHGTISESGKSLPQGVPVKLDCSGTSASGVTDQFGGYSIKINATGDCKVSLESKGASASLSVTVYDKPSRYDLVVKTEGGKTSLVRK